jgi:archaellum component FlaC
MNTLKVVMRPNSSSKFFREFCNEVRKYIGDNPVIVELGSYMGESSLIFAEEFPNGKIICIDSWEGGFDDSDSCSSDNYSEVENQFDIRQKMVGNITKIKGLSTSVEVECDLVYIDACHKYECVKNDINHWSSFTKKIISGHDYCVDDNFLKLHPHISGVKTAVNEMLGEPNNVFGDMSWYKILNNN